MELTVQSLDREIATALLRLFEDQLALAGVDNLLFKVQDRVVTIAGSVPTEADIRSILQLASDVPDVLSVISELEVKP
ncbi:MAG: BON domain-containing protein [Rhodothermales bacterium]